MREFRSTHRRVTRWAVHVGLIGAAIVSVAMEPVLGMHILVGLIFVALVIAHLSQRRRTSLAFARQFAHPGQLHRPAGRLAVSDALLLLLSVAMLVSGLWDWVAGHPTKIRWHAITGVVLTGYLTVHTARRWRRLRSSTIR